MPSKTGGFFRSAGNFFKKMQPRKGGRDRPGPDRPAALPSAPEGWTNPAKPDMKLSPEANAAADKFLENARKTESKVTPKMDELAANLPANLLGREYRLKGEDSLKTKLWNIMDRNPDLTPEQALDRVNDAVRYTVEHSPDGYTDGVKRTQGLLKDSGFDPDPKQYKYKWNENGTYQGINSTWRDPETRTQFEVQHHTPESFYAKDEGTHAIYDKMKIEKDPEKYNELAKQQADVFRNVKHPPNVEDLRNFGG
jgi:hypothetical protein